MCNKHQREERRKQKLERAQKGRELARSVRFYQSLADQIEKLHSQGAYDVTIYFHRQPGTSKVKLLVGGNVRAHKRSNQDWTYQSREVQGEIPATFIGFAERYASMGFRLAKNVVQDIEQAMRDDFLGSRFVVTGTISGVAPVKKSKNLYPIVP